MTWLWVIIGVAALGGIIGYLSTGKKEDAAAGAAMGAFAAGSIIFEILMALLGLYLLFQIGGCLFG